MVKCRNDAAAHALIPDFPPRSIAVEPRHNSSSGLAAILRCTLCPGRNKARKSDVTTHFDLPRNQEWCKHYPSK
jgi:hypothetical protein